MHKGARDAKKIDTSMDTIPAYGRSRKSLTRGPGQGITSGALHPEDSGMIRSEDIDILREIPPRLRPPLIHVAGQLKNDGTDTFVIHVVESLPPPSTPLPQDWPIRVMAWLRDGMSIPMIAGPVFGPTLDANRNIEFAGIPTVSSELTPGRLMTWRVLFKEPRGRARRSSMHPILEEMEQALRELQPRNPKWPPKDEFMEKLGHSRSDKRRVNEWLKPHGLNYTKLVHRIYRAQPG
jgi:hypothetical protein